jgi:hypothetical protein
MAEEQQTQGVPPDLTVFDKLFDPPTPEQPVSVVQTLKEITRISQDHGTRDRFLELLQKSERDIDYTELLYAYQVIPTREVVAHLQRHWFGRGPNSRGEWWPNYQPIKPKFREQMAEAFRLSKATNKPIVVYWVVPTNGVHVKSLENEAQIIHFRFTPLPPI